MSDMTDAYYYGPNQLDKEDRQQNYYAREQAMSYAKKIKDMENAKKYNYKHNFYGTYATCWAPENRPYMNLTGSSGNMNNCKNTKNIKVKTKNGYITVCSEDGKTPMDINKCSKCCKCGALAPANGSVSDGVCIPINEDGRISHYNNQKLFEPALGANILSLTTNDT
jgi:hypothetical protein